MDVIEWNGLEWNHRMDSSLNGLMDSSNGIECERIDLNIVDSNGIESSYSVNEWNGYRMDIDMNIFE